MVQQYFYWTFQSPTAENHSLRYDLRQYERSVEGSYQPAPPPSPDVHNRLSRSPCCPSLWRDSWKEEGNKFTSSCLIFVILRNSGRFMHFHWLTFMVYKEGLYPSNIHARFKSNIQTESIQYLHKNFNNCVPQRPEVDEQHCNKVTKRHLVKDVISIIISILLHLYFCFIHLLHLKYTFYRLLCAQKVYFGTFKNIPSAWIVLSWNTEWTCKCLEITLKLCSFKKILGIYQ